MSEQAPREQRVICDLFPVGEQAAEAAYKYVFRPVIDDISPDGFIEVDQRFFDTNLPLYSRMFAQASHYEDFTGGAFQTAQYMLAVVTAYNAFEREAEIRGGVVPKIEEEVIDRYMDDIRDPELRGKTDDKADDQTDSATRDLNLSFARLDERKDAFFRTEGALSRYFTLEDLISADIVKQLQVLGVIELHSILKTNNEIALLERQFAIE